MLRKITICFFGKSEYVGSIIACQYYYDGGASYPGLLNNHIRHWIMLCIQGNDFSAGVHGGRSQNGVVDVNAVAGIPLAVQLSCIDIKI
jgi:hypothetical protein